MAEQKRPARYTSSAITNLVRLKTTDLTPYRRIIVATLRPHWYNPQNGPFGFADLIEARFIALIRAHQGVSKQGAERLAETARDTLGTNRPFSEPEFPSRAGMLAAAAGIRTQLDIGRLKAVQKTVQRDREGEPARWDIGTDALGRPDMALILDPSMDPHQPVMLPSGIAVRQASHLSQYLPADDGAERLGVTTEQFSEACRLSDTLEIMSRLRQGWDYHHLLTSADEHTAGPSPDRIIRESSERNHRLSRSARGGPEQPIEHVKPHLTNFMTGNTGPGGAAFLPIYRWTHMITLAAPTVGDLAHQPLEGEAMLQGNLTVRYRLQMSVDEDQWIRASCAAWLGEDANRADLPHATAELALYSGEYVVHEAITALLPPSGPDMPRLKGGFHQWALNQHPHSTGMHAPPHPNGPVRPPAPISG